MIQPEDIARGRAVPAADVAELRDPGDRVRRGPMSGSRAPVGVRRGLAEAARPGGRPRSSSARCSESCSSAAARRSLVVVVAGASGGARPSGAGAELVGAVSLAGVGGRSRQPGVAARSARIWAASSAIEASPPVVVAEQADLEVASEEPTSRRVARRGRLAPVKASQARAKVATLVRPPLRWAASIGQMPPLSRSRVGADDDAVALDALEHRDAGATRERARRWSAGAAAGLRMSCRIGEGIAPAGPPRARAGAVGKGRDVAVRVLVAAFGDAGHAFPAIALARALRGRGHEVVVETWERWREAVEGEGWGSPAAEEYRTFPPPPPDAGVYRRRRRPPWRWCRCSRSCGRTSWSATS